MTRSPFPGSPLTGTDLMTGLNSRFKQLYDASPFNLTSVGGTVDDVTATLVPALDGDGLLDGMMFTLVWAGTNTGGMTLALNGGSALPVLTVDGSALGAGSVEAGLTSLLVYQGGDFIVLSGLLASGAGAASRYRWVFTASGTWTKPSGLDADTPVFVEAWGAGGGASGARGGGGGGYGSSVLRLGDLGATETVTIGAGGSGAAGEGIASNGGNTTFGSHITGYGGGGGSGSAGSNKGGGGGGSSSAGSGGTPGRAGGGEDDGTAGGNDAKYTSGGGAGGNAGGGWAEFGGAGGATTGGISTHGGNGGSTGAAGTAPGGGGGPGGASTGASGARGEVRVWI